MAASLTPNVPSAATVTAPASSSAFSWIATPRPWDSLRPNRIDRNADARNVVYMVRASDASSTPLSTRYCIANRPDTSALASSIALYVSFSSCRTVVRRPPTVMA